MTLQNKNAIIYGAGGSLGGAVARTLATNGARVFLTGQRIDPLNALAAAINEAGGQAEVLVADALDELSVQQVVNKVVERHGTVDISFNAISFDALHGTPLVDMKTDEFLLPISQAMRSHFITATAAAREMVPRRSGVILSLTATSAAIAYPFVGGFGPAGSAIELFATNLAAELGPYGIRVVNIRSAGSPDSRIFKEAIDREPGQSPAFLKEMENDTMLKQMPSMQDIANVAAFLVSDLAAKITGVTIDVTAGTTAGLNYRVARQVG